MVKTKAMMTHAMEVAAAMVQVWDCSSLSIMHSHQSSFSGRTMRDARSPSRVVTRSGTCWRWIRALAALLRLWYWMTEKRLWTQRVLIAVKPSENAARVGDPTVRATGVWR